MAAVAEMEGEEGRREKTRALKREERKCERGGRAGRGRERGRLFVAASRCRGGLNEGQKEGRKDREVGGKLVENGRSRLAFISCNVTRPLIAFHLS